MRTIRLGRTNVQVPAISLGTWGQGGPNINEGASVGWTGHDDTQAKEALVASWRAGITHWDTADAYGAGHAERLIGDVLKNGEVPRNELFIATKFGYVKGPSGRYYDPAFMRAQCEASLRNMGIDTIDLYYFHHCNFEGRFDEALATMHKLRDEGKVRFIGLSDWDASKIMEFVERANPDVVQPFRNLVDDEYESSGLKAYVDGHDLGVAFFSPLKHGLLLGKYDKPHQFEEGDFRRNVPEFLDAEFIERMKRASATVSQKMPVLRAVTQALLVDNPTACVLLGQRNAKQVAAAAEAGEALTREEAEFVRRAYGTS